ncbi:DUF3784 domain-containing protein [Clostridium estertheticum]|uniref:DUF3784 domain-containing protein n=1 Tax=Clostridium estertheticum TaxID=238834 RepID=UPI0013E93164|nr:DUF3784 domain-containing protein [Clostridium estertheticum]MBZ9689881.1 DUF3784 domain-containing protein [Clostridium estertheticum]
MWFVWIIVGIFSIITMILLCGKCSFLVAGYNMMSKDAKEKYDEKKVCKGAGVTMLLINLPLIFIALYFQLFTSGYKTAGTSDSFTTAIGLLFAIYVVAVCAISGSKGLKGREKK